LTSDAPTLAERLQEPFNKQYNLFSEQIVETDVGKEMKETILLTIAGLKIKTTKIAESYEKFRDEQEAAQRKEWAKLADAAIPSYYDDEQMAYFMNQDSFNTLARLKRELEGEKP